MTEWLVTDRGNVTSGTEVQPGDVVTYNVDHYDGDYYSCVETVAAFTTREHAEAFLASIPDADEDGYTIHPVVASHAPATYGTCWIAAWHEYSKTRRVRDSAHEWTPSKPWARFDETPSRSGKTRHRTITVRGADREAVEARLDELVAEYVGGKP